MKPQITYMITADAVIQDNLTSKYTLIGIFDDVLLKAGTTEPFLLTFVLFFKVQNTKGTSKIEIKVLTPSGKDLFVTPLVVSDFTVTDKDSLTIAATLQNIPFIEIGKHSVEIFVNGIKADSDLEQVIKVVAI